MIDYDVLKASDGAGNAVLAHITAPRSIGATVIEVDSVANWPDSFIVTTGTLLNTNFLDPDTITEMRGHLNAGDIVIDGFEPGYSDLGNTTGQVAIIKQTTGWANSMVENAQVSHNDDGTIKPSAIRSALDPTADVGTGWNALGLTPDSITNNGQRSYNLVFNAADLTQELSPGMRLKLSRTVTAPVQCADLEASSSQYFSKSSPVGMTFTDDATSGAWIKLESYGYYHVQGRFNGTSGWYLAVNASGQVEMLGFNGGASNFRGGRSYQSIPLGKWVHIAATLDMSGQTHQVYIDGVAVPTEARTAGTNPTALIQAGDYQVGAANGSNHFDGKVAQPFINSTVLSAATIRSLMSQTLTGSETGMVSAYSLSNSIADLNTSNANNLTAQGGAAATNTDSPFALGSDATGGYTAGTTEFGIVTKVAFSTNTTVTVQVPLGGAIPTSGGVSAVAYSVQKTPLGFPAGQNRWVIEVPSPNDRTISGTVYTSLIDAINVPIGDWRLLLKAAWGKPAVASTTNDNYWITLSSDASNETNPNLTMIMKTRHSSAGASSSGTQNSQSEDFISLSSAATFTLMAKKNSGADNGGVNGASEATTLLRAVCGLL